VNVKGVGSWVPTPCSSERVRRLEEHIASLLSKRAAEADRKVRELSLPPTSAGFCLVYSYTLKMKAICFSEMSGALPELHGIRTQKTVHFSS
jgi:hypothetical protein